LAKAYLFSFKFDHIIQDIREGEGSALVDQDSAELTVNLYKLLENGTLSSADVKFFIFLFEKIDFGLIRLQKVNQCDLKSAKIKMAK
jgi:hypothetical protein